MDMVCLEHNHVLFLNVFAYIFRLDEIFFPKILLILDNQISVGNSVVSFLNRSFISQ